MGISTFVGALRESRLLHRLIALALAAAVIVALIAALIVTLVDNGHPAPAATTEHAVRVDSPAVVRILSLWDGQLDCQSCAVNGSDVTAPESGAFSFYDAGSGAFISPDGYVMTADHVLEHDTSNVEDLNFLLQTAASDWANRFGSTSDHWLQYYQNHADAIRVSITTTAGMVYLSTSYTGQLQNTSQVTSFKLQRVVASSPIYKQDVSIFKVEAHDMPFLTLAPASSVNVGDAATAITFPGDADLALTGGGASALLNPAQSDVNTINSLLSPSVQTGQVTASKSQPDGTPVYETSGIGAQGSSGGAFINQQGQIIGFDDAGPQTDRLSFLVPSSVVADYAREANVPTQPQGGFMSLWSSAINDYDSTGACHYSHATSELQQLRDQYPGFGAAEPLLVNAQEQAGSNCPSPLGVGLASGAAAGLLALIALGMLAYVMLRRQRVPWPVPAGGQASGTYPAPPGGMGAGPVPQPPAQSWAPPYTPPYAPPYEPPPSSQPPPDPPPPSPQSSAWNSGGQAQWPGPPPPIPEVAQPLPTALGPQSPVSGPTVSRVCSNGHVVADPTATACPFCGSPVWQPPSQA